MGQEALFNCVLGWIELVQEGSKRRCVLGLERPQSLEEWGREQENNVGQGVHDLKHQVFSLNSYLQLRYTRKSPTNS